MSYIPPLPADPSVRDVVITHARLREFLLRNFALATPQVLASALAYELASIIGTYATDVGDATRAVDAFVGAMQDQIRHFGVGRPHP